MNRLKANVYWSFGLWRASVPGDETSRPFLTWREAYQYAYWAVRVRNVAVDVMEGLS